MTSTGSSKMPTDMDAQTQFLEDEEMEKAVQESLLSKARTDSKYASYIDMLNEQLLKLGPNDPKLQVEDVSIEYRQGDCLFAAIIMQ